MRQPLTEEAAIAAGDRSHPLACARCTSARLAGRIRAHTPHGPEPGPARSHDRLGVCRSGPSSVLIATVWLSSTASRARAARAADSSKEGHARCSAGPPEFRDRTGGRLAPGDRGAVLFVHDAMPSLRAGTRISTPGAATETYLPRLAPTNSLSSTSVAVTAITLGSAPG